MENEAALRQRIEELRRRLYESVPGGYDPRRLQEAHAISEELDRLVIELTRAEQGAVPDQAGPGTRGRRSGRTGRRTQALG